MANSYDQSEFHERGVLTIGTGEELAPSETIMKKADKINTVLTNNKQRDQTT